MLRTHRSLLFAFSFATAAGCATVDSDTGPTPYDDDPPLSSYEDLMADAPANDTLPFEGKADEVLPAVFDELVAEQSPVKSQGSRGVCSIFATTGLMEHLYIKAGMPDPDFSEQFLQWSTKVEAGEFTWTEGSNGSANLRAIHRFGIPEESAWPYESFPWSEANDPDCKKPPQGEDDNRPVKCYTNGDPPATALAATRYKLPRGRYLNTNSIKSHLKNRRTAVVVGLDFFYQSWNHRRSTLPINTEYWRQGYVLYPNAEDRVESHKQRAGHAVVIVGWDDTLEVPIVDKDGKQVIGPDGQPVKEKGFYIFKNSWGTAGFGIQNPYGPGYGYISQRYVHEEGSVSLSDVPAWTPPAPSPPSPPPAPAGEAERYETTAALAIPDNDARGVTSELHVPTAGALTEVKVTVDITHPYVGDLVVTLAHEGKTVTLQERTGGADDDLKKTFTVSDLVSVERGGVWTLKVVDAARYDEGTLNAWSLELR